MNLSEVGEKKFLQNVLPTLFVAENFINGFGSDISILDLGFDSYITFKIDRASKPILITNNWIDDWAIWGRLGVISNLSDHAAAGSTAKAVMISIITPRTTNVEKIEQIIRGCEEACLEYGVSFVGGDTKEGNNTEVVVSCIGITKFNSKLLKTKSGDKLYIEGTLGGCLASNLILLNKDKFDESVIKQAFQILNTPMALVEESKKLYGKKQVFTATDLSDGLYDAVNRLCGSGIGFKLNLHQIPFHPLALLVSQVLNIQLIEFALSVGDWAIVYVLLDGEVNEGKLEVGEFNDTNLRTYIYNNKELRLPNTINEQFVNRLEDQSTYLDGLK